MDLSPAAANAPRNRRPGGGGGGGAGTFTTNGLATGTSIVDNNKSKNGSIGNNNDASETKPSKPSKTILRNNIQNFSRRYWKQIAYVIFFFVKAYIVYILSVTKRNATTTGSTKNNSSIKKNINETQKIPTKNRTGISINTNNNIPQTERKVIHKKRNDAMSSSSTSKTSSYWEKIIPTNHLTTPYYIIHDWEEHIKKTKQHQQKYGTDSIRKYITAYIEPWYMFNDTIPGTGSRGDVKNDKDPGTKPEFVIPLPLRAHTPNDLVRYVYNHSATTCNDIPSKLPIDRGLEIDPLSGEPIVWNVGNEPTGPTFPWDEAPFCPCEADPFLPWIHDMFPDVPTTATTTSDTTTTTTTTASNKKKSTKIQFIAQNKRKCRTGTKYTENVNRLVPQVTLFQSISVQRITEQTAQQLAPTLWQNKQSTTTSKKNNATIKTNIEDDEDLSVRYRLAPYDESDHDGMYTRFICQFRTTLYDDDDEEEHGTNVLLGETLSIYPFNYEMVSYRKNQKALLSPKGKDSILFWTSNLRFDCPIPEQLQTVIGTGISIIQEKNENEQQMIMIPTIHVDLIPIRTSVRYDEIYLTEDMIGPKTEWVLPSFDPHTRWGANNVLPHIEASGRWTNLPICFPPQEPPPPPPPQTAGIEKERQLRTDQKQQQQQKQQNGAVENTRREEGSTTTTTIKSNKRHYLSACLWASAAFKTRGMTRGSDTAGNDRLAEWIEFHLLAGFDHIYLYDNTGAHTNETSLQPIVDMFHPSQVTRIDWPSIICNNNVPAHDSPGERSTQYAAENSCRTRHAPFTEWIAAFDTDEYFVPMGNYTNLKDYLHDASKVGTNIISFRSSRGRLRQDKSTIASTSDGSSVEKSSDSLYLEAYNCDSAGSPKPSWGDRARKQIYRSDYVLYHFVHYSTVTQGYLYTYQNATTDQHGGDGDGGASTGTVSWNRRYGETPPSEHLADEINEAVMVHTKTLTGDIFNGWKKKCKYDYPKKWQGCWIAFPWPLNSSSVEYNTKHKNTILNHDENGYEYNCYINTNVDNYWVPKLRQAIHDRRQKLQQQQKEQQRAK